MFYTDNYTSVVENNSVADPKIINGHKASDKAKMYIFVNYPMEVKREDIYNPEQ
jgi:hypothetical protein